MHILVTSAGSNLAQALIQGLGASHDVRATERQAVAELDDLAVSPLGHDMSTNLLVRGVDAVVHCGEPLPGEPAASYVDYMTRCTYNLLHAAHEEGVKRVIYLSTLDLMAAYPVEYAVSERWRPLPTPEHPLLGKHLGEAVCREFAREFKLTVAALRLGHLVEASGEADDMAVTGDEVIQAVSQALAVTLPHWSVVHVQGEFPGARFAVGDAKKLLNYAPRGAAAHTGKGGAG